VAEDRPERLSEKFVTVRVTAKERAELAGAVAAVPPPARFEDTGAVTGGRLTAPVGARRGRGAGTGCATACRTTDAPAEPTGAGRSVAACAGTAAATETAVTASPTATLRPRRWGRRGCLGVTTLAFTASAQLSDVNGC
jgi:hypothetical protein